jgi:excisionase family DNA binding protein
MNNMKKERRRNMNNLFTCQEVAERYRVEVLTVWNWIRKKRLPAIKIGRDYRVREDSKVL